MPIPEEFVVSGTPQQLEIIIPLLEAQYQFFKNLDLPEGGGGSYRPPVSPDFKDYLQLTFHWIGVTQTTLKNHTVEKSVRLKNIDAKNVSLSYLQDLGRKVLAKFDNLDFKTGHVKAKYSNWKDGFQTWGYFDSKETGYKIIESIGDVVGKTIDKKLLKYEYRDDVSAFDDTPTKVTVAGKAVRPKAKAPIANMRFRAATVLFPWIGHEEQLCNISGYLLKDLSFLDAYDD
jgi:hypothetical protein